MTSQTQQPQSEFAIQKLYLKDLSYEAPHTPEIFHAEWKPEVNLNLQTASKKIEDHVHEVVLTCTVTVKSDNRVAFIVEIKQAGIFTIKDFPQDQMGAILGSVCPGIIFPYAREAISDVIVRGGFPQLYLQPLNFDALYAQQLEQQGQKAAGAPESEIIH